MTHADPARFDHEGDTRVDLATRNAAEESCDMVEVLKQSLLLKVAETCAAIRMFDRELAGDADAFSAQVEDSFEEFVDRVHLGRLKRIARTGRDD